MPNKRKAGPEKIPSQENCPLEEADDKFNEVHFFIEQMMLRYHEPEPFRYNLNAFLQALRNVTVLQQQMSKVPNFHSWYEPQQEKMRSDQLLRRFVESRNIVVKSRNLLFKSKASVGLFRYRKLKLAFDVDVSTAFPSHYVLSDLVPKLGLIDDDHSAIGEEYGVKRQWIAPELGDENVLVAL